MLKKDLIKKIVELEKDNREIVDTFLKALRLVNKNDIKIEISPAVKEWFAYDIRIAKSKKPIKWKTYGGVRMWEYLDKIGFPSKRFIKVLKELIRSVKKY